jgi:hypothetical protein
MRCNFGLAQGQDAEAQYATEEEMLSDRENAPQALKRYRVERLGGRSKPVPFPTLLILFFPEPLKPDSHFMRQAVSRRNGS